MYQKITTVNGHGFFRKSKAYGLVCGIALFGAMVTTSVSAEEIVTETTPAVEVVNPNPATNLETVQETPSAESLATQAEAGQKTGELTSPVTSTELDQIVTDAKEAGVIVTEESKPAAYENLDQAQADLTKQTDVVKEVTDKQEANTTAIKEVTDKNAEIDRQNKAEAERVAEYNKTGQEAVDARNKAGQEAVDARNTQAIAKRESEAEAVEARNKAGQEAVDARNKSDQAMTDAINKAEQERADLENARLKAEYEAELAKIANVEAYNAEIRKRNAEAIAKAEADNARLKVEYEAKKAEMQAKTKENGYLSEVVAQSLIYKSEPNVTIGTIEGVTKFVNPEKRQEVSDANRNLVHTVSSYSEGDYVGTVDYSNGTTFLLNVGQTATVTYVGDFSASANGEKVTKVVARYTAVSSEKGASIVTVSKDPTETVIFGSDATQGLVGVGDELHIEKTFYTASGKVVATKENPIIFSISSMNSLGEDGYFEYVKDLSSNMRFVPITGSQVQDHDGKIYASTSIDTIAPYRGHDSIDSPVRYYGSGALVAESGDTFGLTVGASKHQTGHWFAMNTNVAAPVLPPLPPYKQITPEQEKEVPTKPVEPTYVTPTLVTFTPEVFVPEKYNPEPFVPEVFTPETFDPITPKMIPRVEVPEKETYSVSVHPVIVKQTPANIKAVVNEDGVDVNGKLVPKGSTQTWVLTNSPLVAGREVVTSYTMPDPLPAGFEIDREATAIKNTAWTVNYDENGKTTLSATQATLDYLNAKRDQDVTIPLAYFVGRPINDGGTYKNTFTTLIATPKGEYKVVSNIPVIYTPGNDPETPRPPHTPGGENPTPDDNLIKPKKDVVDEKGNSINGQSVLPNTVLNYVAEQDFDQYKGIVASQNAIGKGFLYVDDYLDEAIDGTSLVVNSITAANGDDVRELFDMIHVLSKDSLDEKLQALIQDSGISPVGEFYLWVAKDPEAFYKAYVQQGLDITRNLSFKIKQDFVGTITNQTHQVDFGNGYYGNIVTNEVPQLVVHKDVLDKDGKSINNGTVQIGDLVTYKLEGWVIPAGRGYDIKEYRFVDLLQHSHDDYQSFVIEAKVDFTLPDGTVIKKGDDLSSYTETVYNAQTGKFETRFKEAFLAQITREQAFGADGYITVKRIASGEVVNEYTLYVNGNPVISNKVVTNTPEPPKPESKAPKQEAPALPSTGQSSSLGLTVLGMVALFGSLFGLRKKNEE
ncbi:TPA: LPXTG cell wall anchor domain-containing protein [Streptococcus suis]|uniref:SspB-related isopeptide-forming adhesin n=1 Tax=Streptococcus suis TaxID=1307 RepID=UPI000942AFCA|nr:SspB-related isopeptide-forming adhesin [Streptococcus suis]NQQ27931.1 LPXTG cell wall anchor domain-containing protein [Streptococcus suis]HEL2155936.1 LPXTG cell wall anchor domain-containing protein [Streptococcus suis]HEL2406226.1 LPXTG cell wall anchor domain-containing protein [Streptococcus suis]HEM2673323.1 LPXTG cell wall anchor domain-containing protein [Streptococcus suis]HEM2675261.1 LPXTG cell wall anchor domain-containing protein [Streptococcus suis]